MTLLSTLMKISQEGTFIVEYMQTIKGIIDVLAMVGHILTNAEIMAYSLNGISRTSMKLTIVICVWDMLMTFE